MENQMCFKEVEAFLKGLLPKYVIQQRKVGSCIVFCTTATQTVM